MEKGLFVMENTKTVRKPVSKKTRFEVFKRDSFKCQYCGRSAPEAVLHVDHIKAVSKGGDNDLINLITSCADCNGGKSNRALDDDSALEKQRAQLEELNVRREQLEMMMNWREGLKGIADDQAAIIAKEWSDRVPGWSLNDGGIAEAKKLLKKYSLSNILDAMETSTGQYLRYDGEKVTSDSANKAWSKISGILYVQSIPEERRSIYYVRGILRKRGLYVNERSYRDLMDAAISQSIDLERIRHLATTEKSWTRFYRQASELVYGVA